MAYDIWKFQCESKDHGDMEYVGDGDYVCPVCGERYHDDDYDDNDDESIDVYEAADIWASHGKDEDYTFGYSESELERALNS